MALWRQVELPDGEVIKVPAGMSSSAVEGFRQHWAAAVDSEQQRIDGDLLADVIANACPLMLTVQASRDIAERALARLAEIEGVTLLRGPNSEPWKPEPVVEAHIYCEHA